MVTESKVSEADDCAGGGFFCQRKSRFAVGLLVFLFLLGLVCRVGSAWMMRHSLNPDYGIVALMAKHMAEGVGFPLFFYGQAYMGSLEPMVSALFCRAFGFSGFWVSAGTALFGILLLPAIFVVARRIGGMWAGLAALAFCAIGPGGYVHYMGSPRGGYALLLLLTVLLLDRSICLAFREKEKPGGNALSYFVLGGLGGIGWWTNQMIVPAILASAILFFCVLGRRVFHGRVLVAMVGFFAGSAPFWMWNLTHEWWSMEFMSSVTEGIPFRSGFVFFLKHLKEIFDCQGLPGYGVASFWILLLLVLGYSVLRLARAVRARALDLPSAGLLWILVYGSILVFQFSRSRYAELNTPRYLLVLIPLVGIMAGVAVGACRGRAVRSVAWILLCGVMVWQGLHMSFLKRLRDEGEGLRSAGQALECAMQGKAMDAVYCIFPRSALNYMLEERMCFVDLRGDRYQPYSDQMEACARPGVLACAGRPDSFLKAAGGSAKTGGPPELSVYYDFMPPGQGFIEVLPAQIEKARTGSGESVKGVLTDGCRETGLGLKECSPLQESLEFTFVQAVEVCRIRFLDRIPNTYPLSIRVLGKGAGDRDWRALTDVLEPWSFYWSGPRPYHGGAFQRQEVIFAPARVEELRLEFKVMDTRRGVQVAEVQLFGPGQDAGVESGRCDELLAILKSLGVKTLYADRWMAARVNAMQSSVSAVRDPSSIRFAREKSRVPLNIDSESALLVRGEDVAYSRRVLGAAGVEMKETIVGPHVLFHSRVTGGNSGVESTGLDWVGYGPVLADSKRVAEFWYRKALGGDRDSAGTFSAVVLDDLQKAIHLYPDHKPARLALLDEIKKAGRVEDSDLLRSIAEYPGEPRIPAVAEWGKDLQLLGVSVSSNAVPGGGSVNIQYYWTCSTNVDVSSLRVFVHFRRAGEVVFQNDHALLQNANIGYQPFTEVFVEDQTVTIPGDLKAGPVEMWLGLLDVKKGEWRCAVHTDLPVRRRAVRIPFTLEITAN